ncbi:nitroreductase/quinone reductase family protein [Nonomuraea glycinis]|uniref:nitroreductase/quinone reductase family protein n=1 Tax=Nonomuraea glycinis TaxID=2047744 RepID=UPI002E10308D|nr:nitroreductase/quinone reductase family protein [Nonomuraea glycinis]
MPDFNQQIIDQFRANQGQVGPPLEGARLLLLTTTGARTGARHTTPLGYLPDASGSVFVIASAGGAPTNPAWYHNLRANPRVTIEDGMFTREADARILQGGERDEIFARAVEADPGWAEYQAASGRVIPVVALTPVGTPTANITRGGDGLKAIHDAFRRELALVRKEVAESGPGLGSQLRINCLALCQGLEHHHLMEDGHMFPHLDGQHPGLAPALTRLRREHQEIKSLLDELQKLVSGDGTDPATLLGEVERLIAELDAHLTYEEEHLIPILNEIMP